MWRETIDVLRSTSAVERDVVFFSFAVAAFVDEQVDAVRGQCLRGHQPGRGGAISDGCRVALRKGQGWLAVSRSLPGVPEALDNLLKSAVVVGFVEFFVRDGHSELERRDMEFINSEQWSKGGRDVLRIWRR